MEYRTISIQVCTGTACFVMGGADLLLLKEELKSMWRSRGINSEQIEQKVLLSGITCIDRCREEGERPPFVLVDGTVIGNAGIEKIADLVYEKVFAVQE